ncbi:MAG: DUF1553 domain-containing protein [Planctomycetaceae bacterium]|nr:DUF1553 domain-containing protein [Planctomycetaceae bacterium]
MKPASFIVVLLLAISLFAALGGPVAIVHADEVDRADLEHFEKYVRPLLVEHCQGCHGPKKQESGLRVDSREALIRGGDNGPAIVPGKLDEGLLLEAVRQTGSIQMPPVGKLTPPQIDALAAWIKRGAPWPAETVTAEKPSRDKAREHWAFQPIADPPLPQVRDTAWPRDPLDYFILAKLEAAGLAPSPPAEPHVLLRRLSYDLIGLPPTVEELSEWEEKLKAESRKLNNASNRDSAAFSSQLSAFDFQLSAFVSRLLASPHYGERWARHWLDVARYADTKGYTIFGEREFPWAFTYRDYVVRALNADLPYDRFVTEQLAADLITPPVEPWSRAALGFLTVGPRFIDNNHDIIDDRIDVVCRGLMGLTVGCARCHDHKFDPIASREYYGLYGVFASAVEPIVPPLIAAEPTSAGYREFAAELAAREKKLSDFVQERHDKLVRGARSRAAEYLLAAHAQRGKPRQDDFMLIADEADLNPAMTVRWLGYLERARLRRDPVFAAWHRFADLPPDEFESRRTAVLAELSSGVHANPTTARIVGRLVSSPPKNLADVAAVYGKLFAEIDERWQTLQRERPSVTQLADPVDEALRQVLYAADAPPQFPWHPTGDLELIPDRKSQGTWRELMKSIETFRATGPFAPPRAMSLVDLPQPREMRVFLRGNPNNLGEPAPRQFLAAINAAGHKTFTHGSGRLELARAITDPRNPLTTRVIVNRVWMHHFGQPLVRTPSDFGLQSDPPTHPELLDHLATRFMRAGWSLKRLHRWIVESATYRQKAESRKLKAEPSTNATQLSAFSSQLSSDPDNLLLTHFPRRRLDFEQTRDTLVFVSGRFEEQLEGPGVRGMVDGGSRRRTLYAHLDRYQVPGLFRAFDFPSPDSTSPRRDTTTVTPQALFWMNHPLVGSVATQILNRPELRDPKTQARVEFLHRLLYARSAQPAEIELAERFLGQNAPRPRWEQYVQALLMANELTFVD